MGMVALRSESGKKGISRWGKDGTQEECCSDPESSLDFPIADAHWRSDSTSRLVVEALAGIPASVTHRSLRYSP